MKLNFSDARENEELLPKKVMKFICDLDKDKKIKVAQIEPEYADGEALHDRYDVPYEMELNCLIVKASRGETVKYAAVVVPYGKGANMNSKVRNPLDVKEVRLADLDYVTKKTGMEYGSITPIGLPEDWQILVDASILKQENVIIGGGKVISKIMMPSRLFCEMKNCTIVEGLAKD